MPGSSTNRPESSSAQRQCRMPSSSSTASICSCVDRESQSLGHSAVPPCVIGTRKGTYDTYMLSVIVRNNSNYRIYVYFGNITVRSEEGEESSLRSHTPGCSYCGPPFAGTNFLSARQLTLRSRCGSFRSRVEKGRINSSLSQEQLGRHFGVFGIYIKANESIANDTACGRGLVDW